MADDMETQGVDLSASDYLGAVQRGLTELAHYISGPALAVNIDNCRQHLLHLDELLSLASEKQAALIAELRAREANGSAVEQAPPPN